MGNAGGTLRTQVLVVGGGPVGLATALELSQQGISCIVVEPRVSVEMTRPRAKTTSARTMELFRRWGIADAVRARAAFPVDWSDDVVFCTTATGVEITRFNGVLGLDLRNSDLAAEPGQQIPQPVVEMALRDALAGIPTVEILYGSRVLSLTQTDDLVTAVVAGKDGTSSTVEADYAVGADGARSSVRASMGAVYRGCDAGRPNLSIVFRSPGLGDRLTGTRAVHHWTLDPAAPGVLGPLELPDTWWAIATGRPDDDPDPDPVALVRGIVGADVPVEVLGTDPWQARALLVDRFRDRRVFLAGDAAHQNPPWGGHGYNTGIGDAVNLGWKLAAVLLGWAPDQLLDSYESERRPVAQETIDIASQNAAVLPAELALAAVADTAAAGTLARRVQDTKHIEFHCLGLVLGYGYGPGRDTQSTTGADFHPAAVAGNRLPHRWLAPGRSVFDTLGAGMALLGDPADGRALMELAAQRGVPLLSVPNVGVPVRHAYGADLVLVRPDQHIAWLGSALDGRAAVDVLDAAVRGFATTARTHPSTQATARRPT